MSLGAAWWKPALPSCPCRHQFYSREGAKNAFQGRISVSAFTQLPLNNLGSSPYELLYSGQLLWLLLLRLVSECLWPAAPLEQLLVGRRTKTCTGRARFCSRVYLKHTSPQGFCGDTNNPLVSAHHPRKSPLGTQQIICSLFGVHEAFVIVCIRQIQASFLACAWFPSGLPWFSYSILTRLVICVVSLALIQHSPMGFSSHMA